MIAFRRLLMAAVAVVPFALSPLHADEDSSSEDQTPRTRTEFYIGPLITVQSPGGDLKGDTAYVTPDGVSVVPDVDPAAGLGLVFGLKANRPSGRAIAIEGSLQGSRHDAKFGSFNTDANLLLISADFKFFPVTGGRVEPWLQAGLSLAGLTVEEGFAGFSGGQKDVTYSGSGLNLGAGVLMYASERFAVHLAVVDRIIRYTRLDNGSDYKLDDAINSNTISIELGGTFRIHRG